MFRLWEPHGALVKVAKIFDIIDKASEALTIAIGSNLQLSNQGSFNQLRHFFSPLAH